MSLRISSFLSFALTRSAIMVQTLAHLLHKLLDDSPKLVRRDLKLVGDGVDSLVLGLGTVDLVNGGGRGELVVEPDSHRKVEKLKREDDRKRREWN